jgi:hypothetical protein
MTALYPSADLALCLAPTVTERTCLLFFINGDTITLLFGNNKLLVDMVLIAFN